MSRDSSRTQLNLHRNAHADLFEEFTRDLLEPESIYLPAQYQPINPEDEDDVVPGQHAAFGITKAAASKDAAREPAWRDLRLDELVAGRVSNGGGSGQHHHTMNGGSSANNTYSATGAGAGASVSATPMNSRGTGREAGQSGAGSSVGLGRRGMSASSVEGGSGLRSVGTVHGGIAALGPFSGGVRVPVAVRSGMRGVGGGTGGAL